MKILLALLPIAFLLSCNSGTTTSAQNSSSNLESPDIQIQVAGATPGQAYLIGMFADQQYRLDSAMVDASGKLVFKREEPYQPGLLFVLFPDQSFFQLMVDEDQTFSLNTSKDNLTNGMQVEGSLDNKLLYDNLKYETGIQNQLNLVNQQLQQITADDPNYAGIKAKQDELLAQRKAHLDELFTSHPNSFFVKFKKAGQNPQVKDFRLPDGSLDQIAQVYHFRTEFWDNVDFSDERLLSTPVVANKLRRYIVELTPQHPDSINKASSFLIDKVLNYPEYFKFFANWITLNYEPTETSLMDPEAVFVHMVQNYFTKERAFWSDSVEIYGLQLRANEMAGSLVGKKGPDVTSKDQNGQTRSISDIKAPYVVVFLYNPDCDHCQEETPKLVDLYKTWKPKGLEVYAIAIDTDEKQWKDFIAQNGMNWINVYDPTNKSIYAKYFVDNTPEIYVLNPQRTIIAKNLKVDQIEEVIARDQG